MHSFIPGDMEAGHLCSDSTMICNLGSIWDFTDDGMELVCDG